MHGAEVALAPARSLTSHARRLFRERYKGRFRFSALVFGFDLFLLGVVAALLLFNIALIYERFVPPGGGLSLTLAAPALRSSEALAVKAVLRADDGRTHEDVRLRWLLPEWVEVVRAEPPLAKDGSIAVGELGPGMNSVSYLVVRIRAARGQSVPFRFTVTQGGLLGLGRSLTGVEARPVASSALVTEPLLPFTTYADGASLPIVIMNAGSTTVPVVVVNVSDESEQTIGGERSVVLGDLKPGERRVLFFDPVSTPSTTFAWDVLDGSQVVASRRSALTRISETFPVTVQGPLRSDADAASVRIRYLSQSSYGRLLVVHPLLLGVEPYVTVFAAPPSGTVEIPLKPGNASTTKWSVVAVFGAADGPGVVLGPRSEGVIRRTFPFGAAARYYSSSGDQLGVGPVPPKAGERTTYWIVWTIGPTEADFRNLNLETELPDGVRATGKFASEAGGQFQTDGAWVSWRIPVLTLAGSDSQTFAFEVGVSPRADQAGKVLPLAATSTARATDAATGILLESDAPGDDTRLIYDEKASGDGIVTK